MLTIACPPAQSAISAIPRTKPYAPSATSGGVFASSNYALTFSAPVHTFFCRLSDDWVGSDHGTVIFLKRPRACYGAGYPSSSRGFEPNVPRIEVYYGYDVWDGDEADRPAPPACQQVGLLRMLGAPRKICKTIDHSLTVLTASATYQSDAASELDVALATTPERLSQDLVVFRRFAATVRTCKDFDARVKGPGSTWGVGARCPAGRWY